MQAVLILGHKNPDQIISLCDHLRKYFDVYLHMDSKATIDDNQVQSIKRLGVHYFSKYNVKWGSYSIVLATIYLMKEALKNKNNQYFHLISGQDWPMQDPQKIYDTFEHTDKIYMNYFKAKDTTKSGENLLWWVKFYYNYDKVNRRSLFGKLYHRLLIFAGRTFKVNKLKKYGLDSDSIYSGEEWIDIPRDALEYAISKYDHNLNIQKVFSTSFCSDEMWLQTVLCNSQYLPRIDKNIHRYISWVHKHGSYPAILDEQDFNQINNGNFWWGRKIEFPFSNKLIEMLNNN